MTVDYTKEIIENEVGPNLYFMGSRNSFSKLKEVFQNIQKSKTSLELNSLNFVHILDIELRIFFSFNQKKLNSDRSNKTLHLMINDENIVDLINFCSVLSTEKGHVYVEFEEYDILEGVNVVWSSEW